MANTNNENENVTMEQILAAINSVNGKIDNMQRDIDSMKEDMINLKKRQNETDEKFKKMNENVKGMIRDAIDEVTEEEKKASSQPAPAATKESLKDKIKDNLKFIVPAGVVLTAAGGALAYAVYKNKTASCDIIDDVDDNDVIDM